jgi:hypothetical protein
VVGIFFVVDSGEIDAFRSVEGEVEAVFLVAPVDGDEGGVVAGGEVDFQVEVSRAGGVVWVGGTVLALTNSVWSSSFWRMMVAGEYWYPLVAGKSLSSHWLTVRNPWVLFLTLKV